jgi:hypothetical protein
MLSATRRAALTIIVAASLLGLSALAAAGAGAEQTTGPTAPTNLTGNLEFGPGEWELHWSPSTDPVTPQSQIRYRVFQNGHPDEFYGAEVEGITETFAYGVGPFTVYVVAEDKAGLVSKPSNVITCQEGHNNSSGHWVPTGCS